MILQRICCTRNEISTFSCSMKKRLGLGSATPKRATGRPEAKKTIKLQKTMPPKAKVERGAAAPKRATRRPEAKKTIKLQKSIPPKAKVRERWKEQRRPLLLHRLQNLEKQVSTSFSKCFLLDTYKNTSFNQFFLMFFAKVKYNIAKTIDKNLLKLLFLYVIDKKH